MDETELQLAPSEAEAAYRTCSPGWQALDASALETPKVALPWVIARLLQVAGALSTPEVTRAFQGLALVPVPGGAFDAGCVASVRVNALALWHARTAYLAAESRKSTAQLPAELVADATTLRKTMLRVVGYHCVDPMLLNDPVAADLASIRSVDGPFYLDLATDLSRLAVYYRNPAWADAFAKDVQNYRAADAAEADTLASKILLQLGQSDDEAARWLLEIRRGWATLLRDYAMVQRGAGFVFWPRGAEVAPSVGAMHAAVRKRATPTPAAPDKPDPAAEDPAP